MALGALIAVFVLQRCDGGGAPDQSLTEQLLQDSIQYFQNKHGELVAQNITLQAERAELLALQTDHTDLIATLQRTVRDQGKKLKDATVVETNTDLQLPFDLFFQGTGGRDTVVDTLILFANPYANVKVVHDTVALSMVDTLTFWHNYEREGLFKKGALTVYAKNANPYITLKGLKSYAVIDPKPRRIGLGALAGYGISTDLKPRPYIGAGLYYRIW